MDDRGLRILLWWTIGSLIGLFVLLIWAMGQPVCLVEGSATSIDEAGVVLESGVECLMWEGR